jgi:hypothetical protein
MSTVNTYNRIKEVYPKAYGWIIDKLQNLERVGLINRVEDLTIEQVRVLGHELGFTVESSTIITDEDEYVEFFADEIYALINKVASAKGMDIEFIDDDTLNELRLILTQKVSLFTDNSIDLSPPVKEYKLGEKVSVWYQGSSTTATIISVPIVGKHGLLLDDKYEIVYVEESDTPTNYIIALQQRINVE